MLNKLTTHVVPRKHFIQIPKNKSSGELDIAIILTHMQMVNNDILRYVDP